MNRPRCNNPHCHRPRGALRAFCSTCWAALPDFHRRQLLRAAPGRGGSAAIAAAAQLLARTPAPRELAKRVRP